MISLAMIVRLLSRDSGGAVSRIEAYCVKCKKKHPMVSPKLRKMGRGSRLFMQSDCPECGSKMNRIVSVEKAKSLPTAAPLPKEPVSLGQASVAAMTPVTEPAKWKSFCRTCNCEREISDGEWQSRHVTQGLVIFGARCTVCGTVGLYTDCKEAGVETIV